MDMKDKVVERFAGKNPGGDPKYFVREMVEGLRSLSAERIRLRRLITEFQMDAPKGLDPMMEKVVRPLDDYITVIGNNIQGMEQVLHGIRV